MHSLLCLGDFLAHLISRGLCRCPSLLYVWIFLWASAESAYPARWKKAPMHLLPWVSCRRDFGLRGFGTALYLTWSLVLTSVSPLPNLAAYPPSRYSRLLVSRSALTATQSSVCTDRLPNQPNLFILSSAGISPLREISHKCRCLVWWQACLLVSALTWQWGWTHWTCTSPSHTCTPTIAPTSVWFQFCFPNSLLYLLWS